MARAVGQLLLEARIEHFGQDHQQPMTEERLLYVIAQQLTPFKEFSRKLASP